MYRGRGERENKMGRKRKGKWEVREKGGMRGEEGQTKRGRKLEWLEYARLGLGFSQYGWFINLFFFNLRKSIPTNWFKIIILISISLVSPKQWIEDLFSMRFSIELTSIHQCLCSAGTLVKCRWAILSFIPSTWFRDSWRPVAFSWTPPHTHTPFTPKVA